MKHLSPLLVLLPLLASGCYGSTESFWDEAASLSCQQQRECDKGDFEAAYTSMSDCVETRREDGIDSTSTCDYDADQGRECIKATKKYKNECDLNLGELDEIVRACADVHYSCGLGVDLSYDPSLGQSYISSIEE